MKKIVDQLNREVRRSMDVLVRFSGTPEHPSYKINDIIHDEFSQAATSCGRLDSALDTWASNLLATRAWRDLAPNERMVIRAYRAAGGLPNLADPEGLLLK